MERLLVALAAAALILVAASQPTALQQGSALTSQGPAPAATEVDTAHEGVTPAPAATGSGETYYDYALRREWSRERLPFWLRDYNQYGPDADPAERAQEAWRFLNDTRLLFYTTSVNFHGGIIERVWFFGDHKIRVIYPQYFVRDNIYYFSGGSGPIPLYTKHPMWDKYYELWQEGKITDEELNEKKFLLSAEEFVKVELFFRAMVEESLKDLDRDIIEVTRYVRSTFEERWGEGVLERVLPWDIDPPLTVAQVLGLELYEPEEYLPDVLYLAPIRAWGFCIAGPNIPLPGGKKPERRIAIHPQAVGFDWILGKHNTVLHEFVHSWQSFPLGWWYDVELWNEIYSTVMDAYPLDFLSHPYLERLRAIVLRYWSFDSEVATNRVWRFTVGGIYEIDKDAFYQVYQFVQSIYKELKGQIPYLYRTFYSDPLFFITVSDFMKDDAFALDLIFATLYSATCLGEPDDSPQEAALRTQKICRAHREEIDDIFGKTLQKMKEQQRKREEESEGDEYIPSSIFALSWWNRLPSDVRSAIIRAWDEGGMDAVLDLFVGGGDVR